MVVRRPALWLISAGIVLLLTALACWLLYGLVLMGFEDSGGDLANKAALEAWLTGQFWEWRLIYRLSLPLGLAAGLAGALMLPTGLYRAFAHR